MAIPLSVPFPPTNQTNSGLSLSMPPYSTPLVNQNTGMMNVTWQLWFQVLFNRIGGLSAPPINLLPNESTVISNQYIPTTQTVMYTSPGAVSTIIDSFQIQNKSNSDARVSCWIVPPGGSAQSSGPGSNIAINNILISANTTQSFPNQNGTIIPGGGTLVFLAPIANAFQPFILGRQATI